MREGSGAGDDDVTSKGISGTSVMFMQSSGTASSVSIDTETPLVMMTPGSSM